MSQEKSTKKILVALSGGVDSSVAAYLLQKLGYKIAGATMTFRVNDTIDLAQVENVKNARAICEQLEIEHLVFDFTEEFRKEVIDYFVSSYENGETPNPCFICNKKIKFGAFLQKAIELGFDAVATGHYAKTIYDKVLKRYRLIANPHNPKDQSYFLAYLNQDELSKIIFPLSDLTKSQVKKIAEQNLKIPPRKESQDICFVENGDYASIVESFSDKKFSEGDFLTLDGKQVGKHKGIYRYTVGQRRGLNIALGEPVYVLEKRISTNEIIVAKKEALYCKSLSAKNLNFLAPELLEKLKEESVELLCKTRYRTKTKRCRVHKLSKSCFKDFETNNLDNSAILSLDFLEPDFAVAIGQALVLYNGNEVVASGIIASCNMMES